MNIYGLRRADRRVLVAMAAGAQHQLSIQRASGMGSFRILGAINHLFDKGLVVKSWSDTELTQRVYFLTDKGNTTAKLLVG